jgi:hypothetical protein
MTEQYRPCTKEEALANPSMSQARIVNHELQVVSDWKDVHYFTYTDKISEYYFRTLAPAPAAVPCIDCRRRKFVSITESQLKKLPRGTAVFRNATSWLVEQATYDKYLKHSRVSVFYTVDQEDGFAGFEDLIDEDTGEVLIQGFWWDGSNLAASLDTLRRLRPLLSEVGIQSNFELVRRVCMNPGGVDL